MYNVDVLKSLGVVCYSVKHDTSCCQQVRYDNNWYSDVDLFRSGVLSNMWSLVQIDIDAEL